MQGKKRTLALIFMAAVAVGGLSFNLNAAPVKGGIGDDFASIESCVFDKRTGRPIPGASVHIQSTGTTSGSQITGSDGCIGDNLFNVNSFGGDYIQAQHEANGKVYTQEFRIPRKLIPQVYRWDFHLDISRRTGNLGFRAGTPN